MATKNECSWCYEVHRPFSRRGMLNDKRKSTPIQIIAMQGHWAPEAKRRRKNTVTIPSLNAQSSLISTVPSCKFWRLPAYRRIAGFRVSKSLPNISQNLLSGSVVHGFRREAGSGKIIVCLHTAFDANRGSFIHG